MVISWKGTGDGISLLAMVSWRPLCASSGGGTLDLNKKSMGRISMNNGLLAFGKGHVFEMGQGFWSISRDTIQHLK